MYKEQRNGTNVVVPSGALAALAGFGFKFDVLEDNMHVEVEFLATLLGTSPTDVQLALELTDDLGAGVPDLTADATGATNYATDILYDSGAAGIAAAGSEYAPVVIKRVYRLNRGTYRCRLFTACDVADLQIQGAEVISRLSAKTLSNHNVVAANSNLKRQGLY